MTTFTITDMSELDAECPAVPTAATKWERQEADRLWREALHCHRELIKRLAQNHEALVVMIDGNQGSVSPCNDAALLARAHEAEGRLDGHLNGIRHRLVIAARTKASA